MEQNGPGGFVGNAAGSEPFESEWTVYILELNDKTYYTGITNNLNKRLSVHRSGKGSKYVRTRLPFRVVYIEYSISRSSASKREAAIKKMSKSNKKLLVQNGDNDSLLLTCSNCNASIAIDKESYTEFKIKCVCNNLVEYKE